MDCFVEVTKFAAGKTEMKKEIPLTRMALVLYLDRCRQLPSLLPGKERSHLWACSQE